MLTKIVTQLVEALKFVFPAYCANATPVLLGGGRPIDLGRKFWDEKPVFGGHKTFRGFFAGLVVGSLVGYTESVVFPEVNPWLGFILSLGALTGDLTGSFLKRRLGYSSGASLFIVDQLSFLFGALLFSFLIFSRPHSFQALIAIVITPPIHMLTNYTAHALGVKKQLW
ncbi:MAG: CDP-2,3-bis-(O-geranylgeranyl)-sn-glycerol synthase [Thermoproteota archaeon]|nr:CDP-2,3-bis-(O-geranylgeranyl)-sn-glycerol synthase [Thermoproteota archaeon]